MTSTPHDDQDQFAEQPVLGSQPEPEEELSLEQLDEYISGAETLQAQLRARLDAIPRD